MWCQANKVLQSNVTRRQYSRCNNALPRSSGTTSRAAWLASCMPRSMKHGRMAREQCASERNYFRAALLAGCVVDTTMHGRVAVAQRDGGIMRCKAAWLTSYMPESVKHGRMVRARGARQTKFCRLVVLAGSIVQAANGSNTWPRSSGTASRRNQAAQSRVACKLNAEAWPRSQGTRRQTKKVPQTGSTRRLYPRCNNARASSRGTTRRRNKDLQSCVAAWQHHDDHSMQADYNIVVVVVQASPKTVASNMYSKQSTYTPAMWQREDEFLFKRYRRARSYTWVRPTVRY